MPVLRHAAVGLIGLILGACLFIVIAAGAVLA
jgi:hypothetical protein